MSLGTILLIVVILALVGVLPSGHTPAAECSPSGIVGVVLLIVVSCSSWGVCNPPVTGVFR